mgnify:FL=1
MINMYPGSSRLNRLTAALIATVCGLTLLAGPTARAAAPAFGKKPNIILIITDD